MVMLRDDAELINRFLATRDPALREEIILRYVPLVHFVLGRLGLSRSHEQDYEDAVSQGLLGLIESTDRFNPSYGTQFSTYATLRIRGRVLDHLRSLDWLSRTARKRARTVQEGTNDLWNRLGRAPTDEELAGYLSIDLPELQQSLMDASHIMMSLDSLVDGGAEGESSLHEMLPDERQLDPSDAYEEQDAKQRLADAIQGLSEREQLVLSLYYFEELTLKEIGAVLQVSESRVCQLHARAVINLKAVLNQGYVLPPPACNEAREPKLVRNGR